MGEIVDLDAFRKQREEEEEAKIKADAAALAQEEQDEIDHMQEVLSRIMISLTEHLTGSAMSYSDYMNPDTNYDGFSTYYVHEAGYDDDGYYEKSWDFDPFTGDIKEPEDEEDF
jgi:hypothetical protein